VPSDGYNEGRAHIIVVTFLHKRVFHPKALVVNWHKPRENQALELMAYGRVLWFDAMTHEGERISMINIHQATSRRPDVQRRVNTHIQAEMKKSGGRRGMIGGDLNAATSHTGYSFSIKSPVEKVDNHFQEFIQRTGGSLIQSEVHTHNDLMGGARRKKLIQSKYRAFNQFSTQSCAQLPKKSSLTLTMESVLERWVSGVYY